MSVPVGSPSEFPIADIQRPLQARYTQTDRVVRGFDPHLGLSESNTMKPGSRHAQQSHSFMDERRPTHLAAPNLDHGYHQSSPNQSLPHAFPPQHIGRPMTAPGELPYMGYSPYAQSLAEYPPPSPLLFHPIKDQNQPIAMATSVRGLPQNCNQLLPAQLVQQQHMWDPHFCLECGTKLVHPSDLLRPPRFDERHGPEACAEQRLLNNEFLSRHRNVEHVAMASKRVRESAVSATAVATTTVTEVPTLEIAQHERQETKGEAGSPERSNNSIFVTHEAPNKVPLTPTKTEGVDNIHDPGQPSRGTAVPDLQDASILSPLKEAGSSSSTHPNQAQIVQTPATFAQQHDSPQLHTSNKDKAPIPAPAPPHQAADDDNSNPNLAPLKGRRPTTPTDKDHYRSEGGYKKSSTPSPSLSLPSSPSPTLSAAEAAGYDVVREIYPKPTTAWEMLTHSRSSSEETLDGQIG